MTPRHGMRTEYRLTHDGSHNTESIGDVSSDPISCWSSSADNMSVTIATRNSVTRYFRRKLKVEFCLNLLWNSFFAASAAIKSQQLNLWWWAIPKIHMYLILRFYSNRENLLLVKYMCFTVNYHISSPQISIKIQYLGNLLWRMFTHWKPPRTNLKVTWQFQQPKLSIETHGD